MGESLSCGHCGKPAEERYRCSECDKKPLCLRCALEAGLLGMDAVMKQRADDERARRQAETRR
jgi:ZZ type zinc finger protein